MKLFVRGKIHPTVLISESSVLGDNVTVGANTIIYDNVRIGPNSVIGPQCILGEPIASFYSDGAYENTSLELGEGALLRSGTIIYSGSTIGSHFETGHRVTIREDVHIGHHARVGTYSDIQDRSKIGNYARLHSSVHIGQMSTVGDFVWIFPNTVLTNDPHPPSEDICGVTIEDYAVIGAQAVLMPGIRIGAEALIGAGSVVYRDVPQRVVVAGNPARRINTIDQIKNKVTGEYVYPWPEYFDRRMPWKDMGFKAWDLQRREGTA